MFFNLLLSGILKKEANDNQTKIKEMSNNIALMFIFAPELLTLKARSCVL